MLRTGGVRAGRTKFATRPHQVQKRLEALVDALRAVSARDDLSPVAKAAWASYNLLALHPFADGNGRLARGVRRGVRGTARRSNRSEKKRRRADPMDRAHQTHSAPVRCAHRRSNRTAVLYRGREALAERLGLAEAVSAPRADETG